MTRPLKVIPFVWFYVGWFACVFFARQGWDNWTLVFPAVSLALLAFLGHGLSRRSYVTLLVIAVVGMTFDFIASRFGVIHFKNSGAGFLPVWLISIWLLFVATIPLMKALFGKRWLLAAILGLVFGPLSYQSGQIFELLTFEGPLFFVVYGLFWFIFFPVSLLFDL